MRFLLAHPGPKAPGAPPEDEQAAAGEPVVPWFPAPVQNLFIGTKSWKLVPYAIVSDDPAVDPDVILESLKAQYPGLPGAMLENYVFAVAKAALELKLKTVVRIYCTEDSATIQIVGTDDTKVLWSEQPTKAAP